MAMAGQPLDVISKRLGHSNIAITAERCLSVYTSRDEAASEAFAHRYERRGDPLINRPRRSIAPANQLRDLMSATNVRADQVGSLLRPAELIEARKRGVGAERLTEIEDRSIERILRKQRDIGLEIFTDGEFRRGTFGGDFAEAVDGFGSGGGIVRTWRGDQAPQGSSLPGAIVSKVRAKRRMTAHELPYLLEHCPGPIKMTLPSANQFPINAFKVGVTDAVYPDHSALLWDIVEVIKAEIKGLADDGVTYIQIDAPRYSYYLDPKWRDHLRTTTGRDPDVLLDEAIAADNACLQGVRRAGLTLAIHLCRGNNRSHWYAEGGYDAIAENVFSSLDVDRFLLEYEDERSGSFEPLRFIPQGKSVVLGLVSSKLPTLEDADVLVRRIEEASQYVPLENLALSPQCGFASVLEGNLLSEEEQWAKLRLVVDTAHRVWQ
jgi:5-methyltetrahydropteroyltriglutamate--homocysteine methyltransferase